MEQTNKWKEIWNRHKANLTGNEDFKTLVLELKKANGFDVISDDVVSFESWVKHIQTTLALLGDDISSIYEVGCGSGANLVMFQNFGISKVGGMDYSESLFRVAQRATKSNDIICCEASAFPEEPMYDAVITDSVTQYLPTIEYAEKMFEKMVRKAIKVIAVLDVHNADLKENGSQIVELLLIITKKNMLASMMLNCLSERIFLNLLQRNMG